MAEELFTKLAYIAMENYVITRERYGQFSLETVVFFLICLFQCAIEVDANFLILQSYYCYPLRLFISKMNTFEIQNAVYLDSQER